MHLIASAMGLGVFISCYAFLFVQTNNLDIFPNDKRYLGAVLCLIASGKAHTLTYELVRRVIGSLGLLSKSDVKSLTPILDLWPDEWYENIATSTPHPLDKAG